MIMRIGFLLLLWLFILAIVYALRSDLFGAPVRKLPGEASARQGADVAAPAPVVAAAAAPAASPITPSGGALPTAADSDTPRTLVILTGPATGTTLPLDDDVITIGRSNDSTLAIVDEYTSTYHAKLQRSGDRWLLTDLDSTNGTKVNGSRVVGTVSVPTHTPVTIGTTTFELRP
ncbi:MAG: FHA domain-containing protein [Microbacteriaceae bacterium]|nr:FHA domain-containing protein [Microbacteriaceae bacterium]